MNEMPRGALIWFPGEPGNSRRPDGFTTKVGIKQKYQAICRELYDCEDYDTLQAFVNHPETLLVVDRTRAYVPDYYNPDDGLGWIDLVRRREYELTGEHKMKIEQAFPGAYIKASDLQDREVEVTIQKVVIEEINEEKKPVVYFEGKERGLVLNKTNANAITTLYGGETDDWTGQKIKLYPMWTEYQGKPIQGVRVKLDGPAPLPATGDDEIPF